MSSVSPVTTPCTSYTCLDHFEITRHGPVHLSTSPGTLPDLRMHNTNTYTTDSNDGGFHYSLPRTQIGSASVHAPALPIEDLVCAPIVQSLLVISLAIFLIHPHSIHGRTSEPAPTSPSIDVIPRLSRNAELSAHCTVVTTGDHSRTGRRRSFSKAQKIFTISRIMYSTVNR